MDRFDEMRGRIKIGEGGGGTVIIPPEAGELVSISFESLPVKLDYNEGDTINIKGMKVMAQFSNAVYVDVTNACVVVVETPLTPYTNTVIVRYESLELNYGIKVYSKPLEIPNGTKVLFHFDGNLINTINDTVLETISRSYTTGVFGKALSTKAASGDVSTHGLIQPYSIPSNTMTIEFWAYSVAHTYTDNPLFIYGQSGNGLIIYMNSTNVGIRLSGNSDVDIKATYSNPLKVWNHYAFTFDKGTYSIFVNGKLLTRQSNSYGGDGIWGGAKLIFYCTKGNFDEFLISDEVLYQDDFVVPTIPYGSEKVLQRIYIDTQPTKTIYKSGEIFTLDGAKIMAVFANGAIIDVTDDCVIENNTPLTASDKFKQISYTYDGVTKNVYVNVGVYTIDGNVDLSSAKLLMNFDGNTEDLTGLNSLTIYGEALYGEGKFGQARYFNGLEDCITLPYTSDVNIDAGDFTIAYWLKIPQLQKAVQIVIANNYGTSNGFRFYMSSDNKIYFKTVNSETFEMQSLSTVTENTWVHIAVVRKGDTFTFYVDGKINSTKTSAGDMLNSGYICIGGAKGSSGFTSLFKGYIDDLIITKTALWDSEFTPPSQPFSSIS